MNISAKVSKTPLGMSFKATSKGLLFGKYLSVVVRFKQIVHDHRPANQPTNQPGSQPMVQLNGQLNGWVDGQMSRQH